jgi:arylsulfatase A-like enzyme/Tfp pilus assembly protein PilF
MLAALALAAGAGGWMLAVRPVRTPSGVDIGRLPGGVARERLNLLVVTLDTTRADRVGAYGAAVRTPAFDRLAREGILFEQTETAAPLTLPAHASIFTGRFPPEHGVRDNGGFFVSPDEVTLATVLKGAGFQTGAAVAAYVLDGKWGLNKGFDSYVDDFEGTRGREGSSRSMQRTANEVVDLALPWLEKVKEQRFFAWLHFYDPHGPYTPPEPYATEYAGRPYDGEVAFTDSQLGRVLSFLESNRLLDRTVVVVIGDHGESLGDHGEDSHGFFVYEAATRVPFVIRAPYARLVQRRVADPVRSVDLMPTVLDLLGVPSPKGISGRSLVPLMTGDSRDMGLEAYAEAMYPLHHFGWADTRALRVGRYKVFDAPKSELYDIDKDPGERKDIFAERRALGEQMLARLRQLHAGWTAAGASSKPAPEIDPEVRSRLAALGYVGSFVATTATPRADLPDPKDKIGLFNLMNAARDISSEKSAEEAFPEAVRLLRQVIAADPRVIDAWFMLGNQHFKTGRYAEAIGYFKKALELKPDYDLPLINMANCYKALGQLDAALAGYEHYLRIDPKNAFVRYEMGEIYMDRNDPASAEREFRRALEIDAQTASARVALAVIALSRGDAAAAEREIRAALATKPDVRLAHFNLAIIAEARGDWPGAEAEYRREIDVHPDAYKAAFNLGRLYERLGDRASQVARLEQSVRMNERFAEGYFYLAKAYLDAGLLDKALATARQGLDLGAASPAAPLGHFVIAGVHSQRGRMAEAQRALAAGRALERRAR